MVHAFSMKERYIVYDSESCALHEPDEVAYRILKLYIENNGNRPSDDGLQSLSDEIHTDISELHSCADEIDQLIQAGELFAPEQPVTLSQLYPQSPRIKAMCLHICHDCNLRCQYCFAHTGDFGTGNRSMLSVETGKKAIDFLIAASGPRKHLDIDFFGGEPLMNWPVVKELTYYCEEAGKAAKKDIRLTITTNCLLLDDEKTEFINQHMKNCVLSIDGRPHVNDKMRPGIGGKGSYPVVSKRIRSFIEKRMQPAAIHHEHYVRGTYTSENLDFSEDIKHIAEALQAKYISVEPVVAPEGSGYEISQDHLQQIEHEYEKIAEYLLHKEEMEDPIYFFHFVIDATEGPCLYKRLKGCGVGAEYCAVTPEGDIYPCHQFVGNPDMLMGNVHQYQPEDKNRTVNERADHAMSIFNESIRKTFNDRLMPNKEACRTCFARYHCGGGCPANAYHTTGDLDGLYEIGCALARKRLECSLWMQLMRSEKTGRNNT